jgi:hypothetical protein
MKNHAAASGWWSEFPKYIVSLLKAYYGGAATKESDWGFHWIPKLTGDHSHMTTVADMADGRVKGYFIMGQNPVVGSMNGALHRKALHKLEWLVVSDLTLIETAEFWRTAPEVVQGTVRPEDIQTEVFFFPSAAHTEKSGTFTNPQRLLQWHAQAVEPPGEARGDLQFIFELGRRLKKLCADSTGAKDRPIQALTWDYPTHGPLGEPDAEAVLTVARQAAPGGEAGRGGAGHGGGPAHALRRVLRGQGILTGFPSGLPGPAPGPGRRGGDRPHARLRRQAPEVPPARAARGACPLPAGGPGSRGGLTALPGVAREDRVVVA